MPININNIRPDIQLLDFEKPLSPLYAKAKKVLDKKELDDKARARLTDIAKDIEKTSNSLYSKLSAWDRTLVARHPQRPMALDYIERLFTDFIEMHGDRQVGDDGSTICGIAKFDGQSVVIVAQQRGRSTEENLKRNFGMPQPEGYRKALKSFKFAEKFGKPVITFIDTPGAFPGIEGEERSQGEAIAKNLKVMSGLRVPVISIVIGEGGSGGALGIGVANYVMMLENSIYSVISPESCASILWRDANKKETAAEALKNDAKTALKLNVIDEIIPEGIGGAHRDWAATTGNTAKAIKKSLTKLCKISGDKLSAARIHKFVNMGKIKVLKKR